MMFIDSINWHSLFNKINMAKSNIYIVSPGVDEELAELLIRIKKEKPVLIHVCIDNSEDAIRNGYGEVNGIDKLIQNNISVKESKGNRISFIIVDNNGFILFPESRIFTDDPIGPNAMELDAFNCTRLIAHYFPPENILEKEKLQERFDESFEQQKNWLDSLTNEITKGTSHVTENFDTQKFTAIQEALTKNPPIAPDLQRQIKTYTAKVQFVELKFSGINIQARTVNIPKDAVPINNHELRKLLLTKMKLFQNVEENKSFQVFTELRAKVDALRIEYLKPVTCREGKSIIQVEVKDAFASRLETIKSEVQELNKQLPDIIETSLSEIRQVFSNELVKLYSEPQNFPKHLDKFISKEIRTEKLNSYISNLVEAIFLKVARQAENICLQEFYYDLTFQDFSDKKFIEELQKKKIMKDEDIKGIVNMKNAFAEKK